MKNSIFYKKKLLILVALVSLAGVVVASLYLINTQQKQDNNPPLSGFGGDTIRQAFVSLPKDHILVTSDAKGVEQKMDQGDTVVFIGQTGCGWCRQVASQINQAGKQSKLSEILYLDYSQISSDQQEAYQKIRAQIKEFAKATDQTSLADGAGILFVRNGKISAWATAEKVLSASSTYHLSDWNDDQASIDLFKALLRRQHQAEEIKEAIEQGGILLDVRTFAEYQAGHFEGATLLPVDQISKGKNPDVAKDAKIYVYCHSGNRSATATEILEERGFSNVIDLGGLSDVYDLGLKNTEPTANATPVLP